MTHSWGTKQTLGTVQVNESYQSTLGERFKIKFYRAHFVQVLPIDPEIEIVSRMVTEFDADPHWKVLYVDCTVTKNHPILNDYTCYGEVHVEATNPLTLLLAIAVITLALKVFIVATFTYLLFRFIGGGNGDVPTSINIGIILIAGFLLFLFYIGGGVEVGKGKVKVTGRR